MFSIPLLGTEGKISLKVEHNSCMKRVGALKLFLGVHMEAVYFQ